MTQNSLAIFSKAALMLAEATTIQQAKELKNLALTAKDWAKRKGLGESAILHCQSYALDAERKMGEMLLDTERAKPGPKKSVTPCDRIPTISELGLSKRESVEAQLLAKVPVGEFELLKAGKVTRKAVKKKIKQASRRAPAQPIVAAGICADLKELSGQKFGCIYADPPWKYQNQGTRASTDNHYDTLTVEQICALPVAELSADECHLHLWITNAFLFEAPRIFKAWGFEFKSSFVWVKPQMGIGNYWRNSHEILLLAVRGGLTAQSRAEKSWVQAKRTKHSSKPELVRKSVEKLSPGPRLELFGRVAIPGWTVFGNQVAPHEPALDI